MVKLPDDFIETWLPGYFWSIDEQWLYSLKAAGELRPMKLLRPNRWNYLPEPGFQVSHRGRRGYMLVSQLERLQVEPATIPVRRRDG
jgi:hypothetical protein